MRTDAIREFVERIPAILEEKRGVYSVAFTVAERKTFLAKKRLTYSARFRIDDEKKQLRFTEMLIESGSGVSAESDDFGPGLGFRREITKTGAGPRQGTIEEQTKLFGTQYVVMFEFSKLRALLEAEAAASGYTFVYCVTSAGL